MIRNHKGSITPWRAPVIICAVSFFYFVVSGQVVMAQQQEPVPQEISPSDEVFKATASNGAEYYKNGLKGLAAFLSKNLKYDADARKRGIEGTVFVSFIVEKDGTASNATILRGVDAALDAEAQRVVMLTRWKPASHDGKIVRSRLVLPIDYVLNKKGKRNQQR